MGTFTSLSMVTDHLSLRTSSSVLMLLGLLETSKGVKRELSTIFLESLAEPFREPSRDFLIVDTCIGKLSTVHLSSASLTVRDVKLFEMERGGTTSTTFFWVLMTFFVSRAMRYLNMKEATSDVQVDSL